MSNNFLLKALILSLTGLLLYHSFRDSHRYLGYLKLQRSRQTLEEVVTKLAKEKTELAGEIEKIRNSKSYARKVLRDNYHLIEEEDERIVFFSD
jgi:cell division protein FtsB